MHTRTDKRIQRGAVRHTHSIQVIAVCGWPGCKRRIREQLASDSPSSGPCREAGVGRLLQFCPASVENGPSNERPCLCFPTRYRPHSCASEDSAAPAVLHHRRTADRAALPWLWPASQESQSPAPCARFRRAKCSTVANRSAFQRRPGKVSWFLVAV